MHRYSENNRQCYWIPHGEWGIFAAGYIKVQSFSEGCWENRLNLYCFCFLFCLYLSHNALMQSWLGSVFMPMIMKYSSIIKFLLVLLQVYRLNLSTCVLSLSVGSHCAKELASRKLGLINTTFKINQ